MLRASAIPLNASTAIFEQNSIHSVDVIIANRGGWMTRMMYVLYDLTALIKCFMPLKYS